MPDDSDITDDDTPPLEVKVVNSVKKDKSPYDSYDDEMNDVMRITKDEIKEFEEGTD